MDTRSRRDPIEPPAEPASDRFKRTLVRVMTVQVITLLLLGLLQYTFTP